MTSSVPNPSFVLRWDVAAGLLSARCSCGAQFNARDPVPLLDWLDEHPHLDPDRIKPTA